MTDEEVIQKIEDALDQIRPNIQMDGGDVEFVKFEDGIVYVRLCGSCIRCPMSIYTLKVVIEEKLKEYVPDIQEVVAVD